MLSYSYEVALVQTMAEQNEYNSSSLDKNGKLMFSVEKYNKVSQMYYNEKGNTAYLNKVF